MDAELAALAKQAAAAKLGPLDFTYDSIDCVEALCGRVDLDDDEVLARVARYLGELLRRSTDAKWDIGDEDGNTAPVLKNIPELGSFKYSPAKALTVWKRMREPGWLLERIERYDLLARRARLQNLVQNGQRELEQLRAEVAGLKHPALLPLDLSPASADRAQAAYLALRPHSTAPAGRRGLKTRVAFYLGEIIRKSDPGLTWGVCADDPKSMELGYFQIGGYSPSIPVANLTPQSAPTFFQKAIEEWL